MKKLSGTILIILSFALQAIGQKAPVFSPAGKAINGYDPVAFFTEKKAVKGVDSIYYQWQDATWLFSGTQNRDSFIANPELYAPQYGGYCAYGAAEGHKAPTEADTWTIVNGNLYFNYNRKVKTAWLKNQELFIKKANANWNTLKDSE